MPGTRRTPPSRPKKVRFLYSHEELSEKIKTGLLLKKLVDNSLGEEELMTASQVRSAEILLRKVLPDLKAIELQGAGGGPVQHVVTVCFTSSSSPPDGDAKQ